MIPAELDRMLQDGIAAVKSGQRERGRELLLQVVEADERNEQGWYWLGLAVDDPADKIVALENVLAINPANQTAQTALRKLTTSPQTSLASAFTHIAPSAPPLESISALDDPCQCVYCGAPAGRSDSRCPECKRSLLTKRALEKSRELPIPMRLTVLLMLLQMNLAIIESQVLRAGANFLFEGLRLNDYFGRAPETWLPLLQGVAGARAIILFALIIGLIYRLTMAYYAAAGVMVTDILWVGFRLGTGLIGPVSAVVEIVTDLAACYFLFSSDRSFAVNAERALCVLDRGAKGGVDLNHRGHLYKREGKWALAVAHWRAAVAAMPNQSEFYKDLAIGYAQIGYYDRALQSLEEFIRQSPGHSDSAPLKELVEKKRAADPKPRG